MSALTLYDPRRGRLFTRDFFNGFFRPLSLELPEEDDRFLNPKVDVSESDAAYTISAELPGFTEKQINLQIEDGHLRLWTEHEETKEEDKDNYHLRERRFGTYSRVFHLPENVDEGKIDAKMDKGILTVTLAKREEEKPRKIEIKVH